MMRLLENLTRESPASSPEAPALEISTHDRGNAQEVQRYIATVFQINYGAQLSEFMPLLVSLRLADHLTAALGLRGAAGGRLFCEQYLDHRVEDCVEAVFGQPVQRGRILEMGNLVASNPGHAALLYTLVGAAMYEAGVVGSEGPLRVGCDWTEKRRTCLYSAGIGETVQFPEPLSHPSARLLPLFFPSSSSSSSSITGYLPSSSSSSS